FGQERRCADVRQVRRQIAPVTALVDEGRLFTTWWSVAKKFHEMSESKIRYRLGFHLRAKPRPHRCLVAPTLDFDRIDKMLMQVRCVLGHGLVESSAHRDKIDHGNMLRAF